MSTTISLAQLTPQRLKLEGLRPIDALPDSTLPTRLGRHDRVQMRCGYEGLTWTLTTLLSPPIAYYTASSIISHLPRFYDPTGYDPTGSTPTPNLCLHRRHPWIEPQ
ncbi:uncharacterized protein C8R40DRAFT_1171750 [Lentinula edodes]|uniref:uncharacterized protein n=1 Tax=Lentinula edodes TaxID=5353 RepID=UPI001E8ED471|nr:uncharacterized protein C8R40DRAFT_1171750 [Lentinula edodes]KAH7874215.1 hypothetical protein C8R40DRAFT_1171750 [Lentinula edodes]